LKIATSMKRTCLFGAIGLLLAMHADVFSQCKEKNSKSNNQKISYQDVPLSGVEEFLTLSKTGEEQIFSYQNDLIELVYHVQMFTEIKFTSAKGNFSLFTATSDRTFWDQHFILSAPVTSRELEKMKGTSKIEIILPEDHKVYSFNTQKSQMLNKAIECVNIR
jgi:hypothetical protein